MKPNFDIILDGPGGGDPTGSEKKKRNHPPYKSLFTEAEERLDALMFWVKVLAGLFFISAVLNIILILNR